jgi:hypothetical protein
MAIFHRALAPADEAPGRPGSAASRFRQVSQEAPRRRPVGPEAARTMMWGLEAGGWTAREAGNLVGLLHGLRPAHSGWSEREIEHLRFLRALVEAGRVDH